MLVKFGKYFTGKESEQMGKQRKFYWLKLTDDLMFKDLKIKKLRQIAGGDTYTIIYLKMLLLSKENNGYIYYEGVEPTIEEEIALKIDEEKENVQMAVSYLKSVGYLEFSTELKDIYLPQAETLVGSESESAERVRRFREKQRQALQQSMSKNHLLPQESNETLQCNASVTDSNIIVTNSNGVVTQCNTEKEKEREKELDTEKEEELNEFNKMIKEEGDING